MMEPRQLIRSLAAFAICAIALAGVIIGCNGGGGTRPQPVSTVQIRGLSSINYNSMIPISLWLYSPADTHAAITFVYSQGIEGKRNPMTAVPGTISPAVLRKIYVPKGGTEVVFWWHAVADLNPGSIYQKIYVHVNASFSDGVVSNAVGGPLTFQYGYSQGLEPPPYVAGGNLPNTKCGQSYGVKLPVQGGTEPIVWSVWPPGSILPYFLELTFDGRLRGEIPEGYGPATISLTLAASDSSPVGARQSVGLFTFFIDCEKVTPCAPAPQILFTSIPKAKEGQTYIFQANAAGGEGALRWSIANGSLPIGFNFSESGLLSGTPITGSAGVYNFTIKVCDSCELGPQCDTVDVALEIEGIPIECNDAPNITTTTLPNGKEGTGYATVLQHTKGHGAVSWKLKSGSLPQGITLTEGGVLHGTPASGTGGTSGKQYNFTVECCDSCPLGYQCDTQALVLTIVPAVEPCAPPPSITTTSPLPEATEGTIYNYQFKAVNGEGVLKWKITNPAQLPSAMTFTTAGLLTGVPDPGTAGTYELNIEVTDSCPISPQKDSGVFIFKVKSPPCAPPPNITTISIPAATEGQPYDFTFEATDGEGTLTWSQIGGPALPSGLVLEANGQLHGTPAFGTAGLYNNIEIQVADSCPGGSQKDDNLYNLTVNPPGCADPPSITTTALPPGAEGVEYNFKLEAELGEGALTWSILTDKDLLPSNLILGSDGTISGIPQPGTASTYYIHFQVCDSCNPPQCDDAILSLEIKGPCAPAPDITTINADDSFAGSYYECQLEATGGEPPLYWAVENPADLPIGFALSSDGKLTGNPSVGNIGVYQFNVIVADSCFTGQQSDMQLVTLKILSPGTCTETEPNDTTAQANTLSLGCITDGAMSGSDTTDVFTFSLAQMGFHNLELVFQENLNGTFTIQLDGPSGNIETMVDVSSPVAKLWNLQPGDYYLTFIISAGSDFTYTFVFN